MMLNKDTFSSFALGLVDILDLVQVEMIKKISRQFARGKSLSDDDWKVLMLKDIGRVNQGLGKVITGSSASQANELNSIKSKAVSEGLRDTDQQLGAIGKVQDKKSFLAMNEVVLNTVATKLNDDIVKANLTMLREAGNSYVKNINDVLAVKEVGGISRTEAVNQILDKWAEKGIPALKDKLNREWAPDSYVNMVVRTNSMEIAKKTQERRAIDYGKDLIITSQHADQSPEHAPFANKIFSLSGNDPNYPAFSKALAAGFMNRPNCRHSYSFYVEGLTTKRETIPQEKTDEAYKVSQEQRKLERKIKAEKRIKASQEARNEDTTAINAKIRSRQKDMRAFIEETGRTRRYERESI